MSLILASASPRRRELLTSAGIPLEVRPSDVDETRDPADDPVRHAIRLAERKARVGAAACPDRLVVAADTVVHRDDHVFDKPRDREEARRHLLALSGGWHLVTTGVCAARNHAAEHLAVTTRVRFRRLSADEIEAYLATGEADDKAGAYGIQGRGGALVAALEGSYTNVIGLPLEETLALIARIGGGAT